MNEQKPDYTQMNLDQLRLEASWSVAQFAREARVDYKTVIRALAGQPIQDTNAHDIVKTLNKRLETNLDFKKVPGLVIYHKSQKKRDERAA